MRSTLASSTVAVDVDQVTCVRMTIFSPSILHTEIITHSDMNPAVFNDLGSNQNVGSLAIEWTANF